MKKFKPQKRKSNKIDLNLLKNKGNFKTKNIMVVCNASPRERGNITREEIFPSVY